MPKPRPIQRKTARERGIERDKQRQRKAVVSATRKAERERWGGLTKREERKRAVQKDRAQRIARGERVNAEPVNIVRRSQRPPNWGLTALRSASTGERSAPSLPDGSAPITPNTAAQALANLYREGSPRERSASRPATFFSEENLALADEWARRFVEDAARRARGERPLYPDLESWERRGGLAKNLPHVSGKKLGDTSLTDLALGTLAAFRAAEMIVEAEAEQAA